MLRDPVFVGETSRCNYDGELIVASLVQNLRSVVTSIVVYSLPNPKAVEVSRREKKDREREVPTRP
jgi:hypothetical protein